MELETRVWNSGHMACMTSFHFEFRVSRDRSVPWEKKIRLRVRSIKMRVHTYGRQTTISRQDAKSFSPSSCLYHPPPPTPPHPHDDFPLFSTSYLIQQCRPKLQSHQRPSCLNQASNNAKRQCALAIALLARWLFSLVGRTPGIVCFGDISFMKS